ncbi:MAG: FAD-binding and (Fe-S)-binding domain-containing protein [Chitinophagales bacterium]
MKRQLQRLQKSLAGELYFDDMMRAIYATDASVYRELPLAVAIPKNEADIQKIIQFALHNKTSIIPRTAGTSLAGQCVGDGIVVDVSKHFTKILEVNTEQNWVRVQPGVIRNDLNKHLKPYSLHFGPLTSTASRAMIGGMVGNNSCGLYSTVYGSTRDHLLEVKAILSDGSEVEFKGLTKSEFRRKCIGSSLESQIYRHISQTLNHPEKQREIREQFPKPSIRRRNTGYALDELLNSNMFTSGGDNFNFCKLLAGSEGTLAFMTEIKIHLNPLPPPEIGLLCAHFESIDEALRAVVLVMKHEVRAVELMDKIVLDCTKANTEQQKNRFFIEGDPKAILIIEVGAEHSSEVARQLNMIEKDLKDNRMAYHYPRVFPPDVGRVWALRSAGLGVLSNLPGDKRPVAVIEDTAVELQDLPEYIADFTDIMDNFNQQSVYYAHADAGELHLRPLLNLKDTEDRKLFREIGEASARLVKKYDGSLSGEHGDGRVRAEFIPIMVGAKNYQLFRELKQTWDARNIFNPGKIVDAAPMDTSLRYEAEQETPELDTVFDFSETGGILRMAEKCNGTGDCRKTHLSGGTMCPSYMATRNEQDSTRARANILREFLTRNKDYENPFDQQEIYDVLDLCLSCKGCTSECPSNVDMATMKAEFLHQYYKSNGIPKRAKLFANFGKLNGMAAMLPTISNLFTSSRLTAPLLKKIMGVASERSLPSLYKTTLRKWYKKEYQKVTAKAHTHFGGVEKRMKGKVYFFCDEFTNLTDTKVGIDAIQLLAHLGYEVEMLEHEESGRAHLSKGFVEEAQQMAQKNVAIFKDLVNEETPLVGIEPSAILGFRDEYPKLVKKEDQEAAKALGKNALMIEEFLYRELQNGNISSEQFSNDTLYIKLHGHCHQKSLSSTDFSAFALSLPRNYMVEVIPSGCCGMAGSFGYEAEHYEVSMQVGELVLFPAVRSAGEKMVIAAPGTSCRHQIWDGTGRAAKHPVEVLWEALLIDN